MAVSYANPEDVRRVLARDPQKAAGTAATLLDDDLREHIDTAAASVDGVLGALGYTVPLQAAVPRAVRDVVVAIAGYLADLHYRQGKAHESRLDPVVARYDWAQQMLAAWAKGQSLVPGLGPANPGSGNAGGSIGGPINPPGPGLFTAPPFAGAPGDELYDPDWYRWGESRGWL